MTAIALEQIRAAVGDVETNLDRIISRSRAALASGADIVVFPELATSGYTVDPAVVAKTADTVDGLCARALTEVAADGGGIGGGIIVTGMCERAGDRFFNSVVAVGADGVLGHYRKLHLFDREHDVFTPGDLGLPVVDTEFGRLGACVCYDVRFVEVLRLLSLRGADIVLAPAAWVAGFDAAVPADGLTRQAESVVTQANLDQVAVVAVSQVGEAGVTRMLGGSLAVDAYGTVVAGPLSRTGEDSARAVIDVAAGRAAQVRGERIRPREDRRLDVYSLGYPGGVW